MEVCELREAELNGLGILYQDTYEVMAINEYFENEKILEGPELTANRDSKLRLRIRVDPLNRNSSCKQAKLPLFITNQNKDYFEQAEGGRMRNVFLSHYTVSQPDFSLKNALYNCRRLIVHVIEILLKLYS